MCGCTENTAMPWSGTFERGILLARKKKLKKIPYDLVSYIQIETEAIEDANDKMMISSYCLHCQ